MYHAHRQIFEIIDGRTSCLTRGFWHTAAIRKMEAFKLNNGRLVSTVPFLSNKSVFLVRRNDCNLYSCREWQIKSEDLCQCHYAIYSIIALLRQVQSILVAVPKSSNIVSPRSTMRNDILSVQGMQYSPVPVPESNMKVEAGNRIG